MSSARNSHSFGNISGSIKIPMNQPSNMTHHNGQHKILINGTPVKGHISKEPKITITTVKKCTDINIVNMTTEYDMPIFQNMGLFGQRLPCGSRQYYW